MWTPDEPREFTLALNMHRATSWWIPQFLGVPFCEKPPLTYWASAGSMMLFGTSHWVARVPNLLWAALAFGAISVLGRALAGHKRGAVAGLVSGTVAATFLLALQQQVWLATDAPLYCATAISLLGLWWGLDGGREGRRGTGWVLFGLGLTLGFFAKNTFGWVVPAFTLIGWCLWMRRPRELLQPGLWLAALGTLVTIGIWIAIVARQRGGEECIRTLLWGNGLGRLLPIDTPQHYAQGHRNWFGKYLLQMPWLLFPWTIVALAAALAALSRVPRTSHDCGAWRFCVVATLPAWSLLFLAATGRGVYFLPTLIGVACAVGLWTADPAKPASRLDRLAMTATEWLVGTFCVLVPIATVGLATILPTAAERWTWVGPLAAIPATFWLMTRRLEAPQWRVTRVPVAICGMLVLCAPVLFPYMDRLQDLAPLVRAAAPSINPRIVTLASEETIQAYLESEVGLRPRVLADVAAVGRLLASEPGLRVLVRSDRDSLRHVLQGDTVAEPKRHTAEVIALTALGLVVLDEWSVVGGRSYALMGVKP